MVTYYNKKDLISYGNYLLSSERRELYKSHPEYPNEELLEERLSQANHADYYQWLERKRASKPVGSDTPVYADPDSED